MSSGESARTMIWSTLVKRTGWGVSASSFSDACGERPACGVGVGESWLRLLTAIDADRAEPAAAALWLAVVADTPATRYLIVVHGASRMSSWSMPIMFAPLGTRVPTTRNVTFWTRTSLPTGDS